jgi:tripartite-type tricarboxylate transporter receptor subunit TctC
MISNRLTKYLSALVSMLGIAAITFGATSPLAQSSEGQAYPSRAVTVIVPFPPGGGTDIGARLVAQKLSLKWGQSVVVENRGGAAGLLGADAVAKAKPDGYTLLVGNVGTQSVNPALYAKMPYNPDTAFEPITMIAELPLVLLVTPSLPYRSVQEVIAAAKAEPGKISYASSGAGGAPHLAAEILKSSAGIELLHVPYKGGGPAVADLMAGHVNLLFATVLEGSGAVRSGKLRGLAVSSATRSLALPELPTVAESGVPGFDTGSWIGMLAPAGTTQAIIQKIAADVRAVLSQDDTRDVLIKQGATPLIMTTEQFTARINLDRKRYGEVIKASGIKVD